MKVNILSYNIRKGKGYRKSNPNIADLSRFFDQQNCEIILCQEIAEHHAHNQHSQCCEIARSLNVNHHYGANAYYQSGNHGNAIFTSFPTEHHCNLNISTSQLEYRGVLYSVVRINHKHKLHLFNVHLGLTPSQRRKQMELILAYIKQTIPDNEAVVIAGDFNDFGGTIDRLMASTGFFKNATHLLPKKERKTFPSHKPRFRLDHIYYRHLKLTKFEVIKTGDSQYYSDHLPILSEFEIH